MMIVSMAFRIGLLWLSFIGSIGYLSHVSAVESVRIAAASDLDFAMREIGAKCSGSVSRKPGAWRSCCSRFRLRSPTR
jgi:hypothetical protein